MVRFAEQDELLPLNPRSSAFLEADADSSSDDDNNNNGDGNKHKRTSITPGLNATTREQGFSKQESMEYHVSALRKSIMESFRDFRAYRNHEPSVRSKRRARLNVVMAGLLGLTLAVLLGGAGWLTYRRIYLPIRRNHLLEKSIRDHAEAARERAAKCFGYDWQRACDAMGPAAARRRRRLQQQPAPSPSWLQQSQPRRLYTGIGDRSNELEDDIMDSDDPTVTFDENCLRLYRLTLYGGITFPYHANQLLHLGGVSYLGILCSSRSFLLLYFVSLLSMTFVGVSKASSLHGPPLFLFFVAQNATMALFIQHGAMRNAEDYFCSFKKLMLQQKYRNFDDVLIIAPDVRVLVVVVAHSFIVFIVGSRPVCCCGMSSGSMTALGLCFPSCSHAQVLCSLSSFLTAIVRINQFNYQHDDLVHPYDAFWNATKPWGDWRVGAESDPQCCGNQARKGPPLTISSFEVLDNMLAMLTNPSLFPRMEKISYVGHSAGTLVG